ncbi:MAG: hypothetical protein WBA63_13055 [Thermomicrobiales bacterium]
MYELWDSDRRNMIDSFRTAASAEDILAAAYRDHGSIFFQGLFLSYEGETEEDDALIAEGEVMLVAIKRLAAEERAASHTPPATHRQVG